MAIPRETADQIRATADIMEVVGEFVQLKRRGTNYLGLCPFHNEKTPSFNVNPVKGIYKCFGCGKAGDSVQFLMDHETLSYPEALRWLAAKYNIEIKEIQARPKSAEEEEQASEKESIYIALKWAAEYYQQLLLQHPDGQGIGLSYFRERGFHDGVLDTYQLGYSLEAWDGLLKEAEKTGFRREILDKAGLLVTKEDGKVFDRFRGRVMFPIHNPQGKVVGFGARFLGKDKTQPKYLNSPETPVYHKSEVLYGLFQARKAIREKDNCYLCEGYTDVISLHQGGVENVVASSGTALTPDQIKLIARHTKNITVLYDGDAAGIKASLRGIDLLLEAGMNVRAVSFPEGEDPDSYMKAIGPVAFSEYLTKAATDFIRFKASLFLEEAKADPIKKVAVVRDIVTSIIKVTDPILRAEYYKLCSQLLEVDEQTLMAEGNKLILTEQANREKQNRIAQQQEQRRRQTGMDLPPGVSGSTLTPSTAPARPAAPAEPTPLYDLDGNMIGMADGYDADAYADYDLGVPGQSYDLPPADGPANAEPLEAPDDDLLLSIWRYQNAITLKGQYEREVMRFILEHTHAENGLELDLARYFVNELEEVGFHDPLLARMFAMYSHEVDEGRLPDLNYFLALEDRELANLAAGLMGAKYQTSPHWKEKFSITINREEDALQENAFQTIGALKLILMRAQLIELHDTIRKTQAEDDLMTLLHQHKQLKEMELLLSEEMEWLMADFFSGNPTL